MTYSFVIAGNHVEVVAEGGPRTVFDVSGVPRFIIAALGSGATSVDPRDWLAESCRSLEQRWRSDGREHARVFVDGESSVSSRINVEGTLFVGPGCEIRAGASFRGRVVLIARVVVGHSVEIKDSVLLDGAKVAHLSYVGNSIVGQRAILGAGVVLTNRRLDGSPMDPFGSGAATPLLGAIVGDDVVLGANCVVNPGCVIPAGTLVPPLTSVSGSAQRNGSSGGRRDAQSN